MLRKSLICLFLTSHQHPAFQESSKIFLNGRDERVVILMFERNEVIKYLKRKLMNLTDREESILRMMLCCILAHSIQMMLCKIKETDITILGENN